MTNQEDRRQTRRQQALKDAKMNGEWAKAHNKAMTGPDGKPDYGKDA